jgi:chromosome segregation ATPase
MLKKMVILGVIGFVAVTALGGTKLASYIRSEIREARERAESNIPPEKEIQRLRNEIKLLDKDILAVVNELAKQRVGVNDLQTQTEELAAKQSKDKEILTARIDALEKVAQADQPVPVSHVTFGNRTLAIADAKVELDAATKRYATNQKSLDSLQALLANRIKVRDALEKQLETMKIQKGELTAAVDDMEAQLAALKLQQMESKYQTDDTRLAKIKEDLRKLKTNMDVEKEKLKLMPVVSEPTPAANTPSTDDLRSRLNGTPAAKPAKPAGEKIQSQVPIVD